jgi:hypothetical protein
MWSRFTTPAATLWSWAETSGLRNQPDVDGEPDEHRPFTAE